LYACKRSGHIVPKPHYKAKPGKGYELGAVTLPYHLIKTPSSLIGPGKSHLKNQTRPSITAYG